MSSFKTKFSSAANRIVHGISVFFHMRAFHYSLVQIYLISFVTNLLVESLSRFSFWDALVYMVRYPLIFLVNMLIISMVIAPAILFRKRSFFYLLLFTLCLTVGIVDFVVLHNRVTPFNANDFHMLGDAFNVVFHYYRTYQMILILLAILAGLGLIVYAYFKCPKLKEKVNYKKTLPLTLAVILGGFLLVKLSIAVGIMAKTFPNIADAYHDYGLPYCFACSIVDTGIDKPDDYSPEKVEGLVEPLEVIPSISVPIVETDSTPNIIYIQLESFFDPKRINGIQFKTDPIPTFTYLKKNYTSGLLSVPSISAGTANTEFEILTGMNMEDFGTGEYPYKTILKTHTCESMAYNMKALGYGTHAIHNNTATFYSRHIVFSNLGFDDFDSVEMMQDVTYNDLDWAKDDVLYNEIITALDSTPQSDFVFTVSVQGHGGYPDEDILGNTIEMTEIYDAYSDNTIYGLKYYVSQISEMDAFVAKLIKYLENDDEDTVLVLYGDHLPGFDFSEDDLNYGNLLQTEYVVWSNFDMAVEHRELEAFQLSAYVSSRLNYHEGLITKLHQSFMFNTSISENYLSELTVLSYDMLYGEMYCFGGKNPYDQTDIVYGFHKPVITDVSAIYDEEEDTCYLTVNGQYITPYTDIFVNDERYSNTIFITDNELFLPDIELSDGDEIKIAMPYGDDGILSESVVYEYSDKDVINK